MILKNGSQSFEYWLTPPAKIYRQYYFFDVKNPSAVAKGSKPILIERGPYIYSESWKKDNIEFLDKTRLTYSPITSLQFEPALSNGSMTDEITILNIPLIVILFLLSK